MQDGYYSGNQIIVKFDDVKGVSTDQSPRGFSVDVFLECHKIHINEGDAAKFIAEYKRYLRQNERIISLVPTVIGLLIVILVMGLHLKGVL